MLPEHRVGGAARRHALPAAPWRSRPRCVAFLGALLVAALLHLLIVTGIHAGPTAVERPTAGRSAVLNVRAFSEHSSPARAEVASLADPAPAARVLPVHRPTLRRAPAATGATGTTAEPAPASAPAPPADDASAGAPSRADSADIMTASIAAVEPQPSGATSAQGVPLYATRIPASATLNYRLRRDTLHGQAELRWRALGERYQAELQASVAGAPLFRQSSEGELNAAGLAPERFTDQRARRGTRAISFQREAGRVSFSAVPGALDLGVGMQDRLSWIVQLAAVASANPDRLRVGGEIVLTLVGMRGDMAPWRFVSHGAAAAEDVNPLPPIHLQRLPASTYDTSIDVWLDPAPPHWPVRAHWRNGPADPGLELWRVEAVETR
jgi:Protein of unknown function (DUF3108)